MQDHTTSPQSHWGAPIIEDNGQAVLPLRGHWIIRNAKRETHYYVSEYTLTMIDGDTCMPMSYTILESNNDGDWLKIRVKTMHDKGHDKYLKLSNDHKSVTETMVAFCMSVDTKWEYADARTVPQ